MKSIARLGMVVLLMHGTAAYAGPVLVGPPRDPTGAGGNEAIAQERGQFTTLLATLDADVTVGVAHIIDSFRPVLFYLDPAEPRLSLLFEGFPVPDAFPADISSVVSVGNDPDFSVFTELMTDGIDQFIISGAWNERLGVLSVGGTGGLESANLQLLVPSMGPDLTGYTVERITQVLTVDLQSPGSDPFGDGVWTDLSMSGAYEFYGSVIPEPSAVMLLLVGIAGVPIGRRRLRIRKAPTDYKATLTAHVDAMARERHANWPSSLWVALLIWLLSILGQNVMAQCQTNGSNTQPGLSGSDQNPHSFENRCLAGTGTDVTITIEAMADLGCNAFDGTHDPPVGGQCPGSCTPICCDTLPQEKWVTVTGNFNPLSPSIAGSTNMPTGGQFFENWITDCYTSSQACLEAGRSPCDPNNPAANKRVVTIPADTWNDWLGSSGNTMTIRVTTTSAVYSAPIQTRSLALYCEDLGFNLCPGQACSGLCGPETFSRVSISYTTEPAACQSNADCDDGEFCTIDTCNTGTGECSYTSTNCSDGNSCTSDSCNESTNQCVHTNNSNACNDGLFCNGSDTCSGGSCSAHTGDPCGGQECCENTNTCAQCCNNANCDDNNPCNGTETCVSGNCQVSFVADCNENGLEDSCDIAASTSRDDNQNGIPDECECSNATILMAIPPDCTLDARQPHPYGDNALEVRQGIGSPNTYTDGPEPITIDLGLTGVALVACWDLSETDIEEVQQGTLPLDPNRILSVTEGSPGEYDILLERPISAGQWTRITYLGDVSGSSFVSYASLPSDSSADGLAQQGMQGEPDSDVWQWVYCCFQHTCTPPHGDYSCDINHEGSWNFSDLGRLADLLQGFGTYIVWEGKMLPSNTCPGATGQSMMSGPTIAGTAELENPSDRFLTYLTTTVVPPGRSKEDLFMVIRVLTTLHVRELSMNEKVTLAERLQDPTLTFQTKFVADMIPDIAAALLK